MKRGILKANWISYRPFLLCPCGGSANHLLDDQRSCRDSNRFNKKALTAKGARVVF